MIPLSPTNALIADRYKILNWVGAGGMQNVYAAEDVLLRRIVALKTPKEGAAVKRFQNSSVLSARINHDNIAKTLDYVEDGGRPFLIEEYVSGSDLAKIFPKIVPLLAPSACARVLHQLARGLAASHHAGVVHRDLKPSNIMVVNGPKFSSVKITDFGIAKMAEAEIGEWAKTGTTSSKTVLGAIPYMSPESVTDFSKATFAADIWAVGAITYHLLSGRFPFGSGLPSIAAILRGEPPSLPSEVAALQFKPLGTELYELIRRCLEPDATARISANDLVKALEPLCYSIDEYELGTIKKTNNSYWGFISADDGADVMYHVESFYGGTNPQVGQRVWFARHPGGGADRAFPLVIAGDTEQAL